MTSNPHFICLLFVLVTLLHGCSSNGRIGAPGRGGAATANVAGLKIEAQPSGSDGGDVSINSNEGGIHRVSISGVEVVVNEVSKVRLLNCGGHIDHRNIGVSRHRPDAFWCRNRDPRYLGKIADPARRVRDVSSQVLSRPECPLPRTVSIKLDQPGPPDALHRVSLQLSSMPTHKSFVVPPLGGSTTVVTAECRLKAGLRTRVCRVYALALQSERVRIGKLAHQNTGPLRGNVRGN